MSARFGPIFFEAQNSEVRTRAKYARSEPPRNELGQIGNGFRLPRTGRVSSSEAHTTNKYDKRKKKKKKVKKKKFKGEISERGVTVATPINFFAVVN